jgi:hypothetical protein
MAAREKAGGAPKSRDAGAGAAQLGLMIDDRHDDLNLRT